MIQSKSDIFLFSSFFRLNADVATTPGDQPKCSTRLICLQVERTVLFFCTMITAVYNAWYFFILSSLELYKEFQEEAYSIALHPSGLFILVGFSDKLRLMNLLIDDVRSFKEFTIRGCREVRIFGSE